MNVFASDNFFQGTSYISPIPLSNRDKNFLSQYLTTRILSGALIISNLGHSTLIYLAQINVAYKFSQH